jgi:extradiol dioxygenase family protein
MTLAPFHLAFPVHDLNLARTFYGGLLGCAEGRSAAEWVDFNFFGHQIVAYLAPKEVRKSSTTGVDGDPVPVRHFGLVLPMDDWETMRDRLVASGTKFLIEPQARFVGAIGEQSSLFFLDPSGNALAFKDPSRLFSKN